MSIPAVPPTEFVPRPLADRFEPEKIADETFLIHSVQPAVGAPLYVYLNSLVIRGEEPVIVDTNTIANRAQWLEDVFSIVEPDEVKWVFVSHDDIDHVGNLDFVLDACRNATLVASWPLVERHSNAFQFPLERTRWINDGESFHVGDRTLRAVRPPVWDSPTTRGLFDERTGVYWAVDSFATVMPGHDVADVADLDPNFWRESVQMGAYHLLSPWLSLTDPAKFAAHVDGIASLGMTTIASAHSPLITEKSVEQAFANVRDLPTVTPVEVPGQEVLDMMLSGEAAA